VATEVELNYVVDVAVDGDGNIYIADEYWSDILKVTTQGRIFTFVGRDCRDSRILGDGGPAVAGCLSNPQRVTVGPDGNLYIADTGHNRIRKVDMRTGIITTVAGNGMFDNTGDGGTATQAGIRAPVAVAVAQDGTLYIATPPQMRKVTPDGIISTVAAGLNNVRDIAVDRVDNIYVTEDRVNARVRRIDPSGIITTIVGNRYTGFPPSGLLATEASLGRPIGVALLPEGNLIFTDDINQSVHRLRQIEKQTSAVSK
jgi:glucose/arabinose dehydrogenase